jgi:hypothetical protein
MPYTFTPRPPTGWQTEEDITEHQMRAMMRLHALEAKQSTRAFGLLVLIMLGVVGLGLLGAVLNGFIVL